ncbi:class I SAM-dependent methyltransferase [Aquisalimonas lutea]|uniref:class I SAM-dependent methyltransferase n=1 Tax=Aquisalimonas lutea TaxID=1327750 RepID=UPI0033906A37
MSASAVSEFEDPSRHSSLGRKRRYAERRYANPDQRLVHALETRVIRRYLLELTHPGDRVLDVPCGYGRCTESAWQGGREIVGADINPDMLSLFREHTGGRIPHLCTTSVALPFQDNAFDAALCVRLLQHLHDAEARRKTLAELARVTRHGVIITAYVHCPVHGAAHGVRRLKRLARYRLKELDDDVRSAGLRIARAQRPVSFLHAQLVLKLLPARRAEARGGQQAWISAERRPKEKTSLMRLRDGIASFNDSFGASAHALRHRGSAASSSVKDSPVARRSLMLRRFGTGR